MIMIMIMMTDIMMKLIMMHSGEVTWQADSASRSWMTDLRNTSGAWKCSHRVPIIPLPGENDDDLCNDGYGNIKWWSWWLASGALEKHQNMEMLPQSPNHTITRWTWWWSLYKDDDDDDDNNDVNWWSACGACETHQNMEMLPSESPHHAAALMLLILMTMIMMI